MRAFETEGGPLPRASWNVREGVLSHYYATAATKSVISNISSIKAGYNSIQRLSVTNKCNKSYNIVVAINLRYKFSGAVLFLALISGLFLL